MGSRSERYGLFLLLLLLPDESFFRGALYLLYSPASFAVCSFFTRLLPALYESVNFFGLRTYREGSSRPLLNSLLSFLQFIPPFTSLFKHGSNRVCSVKPEHGACTNPNQIFESSFCSSPFFRVYRCNGFFIGSSVRFLELLACVSACASFCGHPCQMMKKLMLRAVRICIPQMLLWDKGGGNSESFLLEEGDFFGGLLSVHL